MYVCINCGQMLLGGGGGEEGGNQLMVFRVGRLPNTIHRDTTSIIIRCLLLKVEFPAPFQSRPSMYSYFISTKGSDPLFLRGRILGHN